MSLDFIRVRGARVHNLKSVDLELPHKQLVVLTGVSGSGKTSLGIHTLHAEGRRRYVASLSSHARAVTETLPQPDVDWIGGLNPTLAIAQHASAARSRSTVGTLTEIHDHLRGLFARFGQATCPGCGQPVRATTIEEAAHEVLSWPEGSRVMLLAPLLAMGRDLNEVMQDLRGRGFVRVRVDGEVVELASWDGRAQEEEPRIDVVIDRWIVRAEDKPRLVDSLETARLQGGGVAIVHRVEGGTDHHYSARPRCSDCRLDVPPLEPSLFSFNHPSGMCPACEGLGSVDELVCQDCSGARICEAARRVLWRGRSLPELAGLEMGELEQVLLELLTEEDCGPLEREALEELKERLGVVRSLGLTYLSSDRGAFTLSAGELRRLRLAGQVVSTLTGVTYILDEPTSGLHPEDTARVIEVLRELRAQGNSLIVIEHSHEVMRAADLLIDFGPGAGQHGGTVVAQGTLEQLMSSSESLTGSFLAGRRPVGRPGRGRTRSASLVLRGASGHNLTGVELELPLGALTAVTGVSGAGKTSLVSGTLAPAVASALGQAERVALPFSSLEGVDSFEQVVSIDGRPIGKSARSNPATVTRIFDPIRQVFAATAEARVQGYGASRFSFNAAGGRCEVCSGLGELETPAHLLTDLRVPCHACQGARYNPATLRIRYKGATIADVLAMSVDEALAFFEHHKRIHRVLTVLHDVGLGYLPLGRSATTLSGGESQRIKLARELGRARRGARLLILDEPDAGLHPADVERLVSVLDRLVELGDTVVAVAHRPALITAADHVVDLGPGPGRRGGQVVYAGPPEGLSGASSSATGRALGVQEA